MDFHKIRVFIIYFLIAIGAAYFTIFNILSGRKIITISNNSGSQFTNIGSHTNYFEEKILLLPKGDGRPVFTPPLDLSNYNLNDYDQIKIPSQEYLDYFVGYFDHFENLENSSDIYIILNDQLNNKYKFRLIFDKPTENKSNQVSIITSLSDEVLISTPFINYHKVIKTNIIKPLYLLNSKIIEKLIKTNDAIVIVPLPSYPELTAKDKNGVTIASEIILRRSIFDRDVQILTK